MSRLFADSVHRVVETLNRFWKLLATIFATIIAGVVLFPLAVIFMTAIKTRSEFFEDPLALPSSIQMSNFVEAWTEGGFEVYIVNSIIVVFISLAILLIITLLASYALVQFDLPGQRLILFGVITGFMIPPQVLIAPMFPIMDWLDWINLRRSLIAVYVAFAIPFSLFFFRQYLVTIPDSYAEAARLEGCSEFQIFSRIYLPLSMPAVATVFVFQFVLFWNEFLYAIVFITEDSRRTAPAGLTAFQGQFGQDFTLLSAGILIAAVPAVIVFITMRRYFVQGFLRGQT